MPQQNGRIYLPTLQNPLTIQRDKWGVVYILAQTRRDLFYGQGFVHAQDRLWQMELNRRAAKGTLSALFGKRTLHTDRLSRTLGFARLSKTSWHFLSESAKSDLTAYTDGVNALLNSRPKRPFEFRLLNHHAKPWQVLDSLAYGRLQMWALTTGASSELITSQLIEAVDAEKAAHLALDYPNHNPVTLPNGVELNQLRLDEMVNTAVSPFMGKGRGDGDGRGSNGWVIAPQHSQTGGALLANDMHLPVGVPSLWHIQHLQSDDGFKAVGFTQPGLPYVMVGHNEHIAWGATMAYTDGEDLFLERFDEKRPFHYQHQNEWKKAETITEQIDIRGSKPHIETVVQTAHGPLIDDTFYAQNSEHPIKIALASVALTPNLTMDGFGLLNEANDWDGFVTAVSRIQAPALNLLYADRSGNIGHYVSGQVPLRTIGDGTKPRPGWNSDYDWQGVVPFANMPHALNPKSGVIVSANNKIVPDAFPYFMGKMWRNGYRAARIEQLLSQKPISPQQCAQIQQDTFSIPAQIICQQLAHIDAQSLPPAPHHAMVAFCLTELQNWDGCLAPDSIPATVYQHFLRHLTHHLFSHIPASMHHQLMGAGVHKNLQPVNDLQGQWIVSLITLLGSENSGFLSSADKQALLIACLQKTAVSLQKKHGKQTANWRWGNYHTLTFSHALAELPPLKRLLNVGPIGTGGDSTTVLQAGMQPHTLQAFNFANNGISVSTRMVVDLADWSKTQLVHAPGQSGHVGSKHYDDLVTLWENGRFIQPPWTKPAIVNAAASSLLLLPSNKKSNKISAQNR